MSERETEKNTETEKRDIEGDRQGRHRWRQRRETEKNMETEKGDRQGDREEHRDRERET